MVRIGFVIAAACTALAAAAVSAQETADPLAEALRANRSVLSLDAGQLEGTAAELLLEACSIFVRCVRRPTGPVILLVAR